MPFDGSFCYEIMPARIRQLFSYLRSKKLSPLPFFAAGATTSCPPDQILTEVGCLSKDPVQFIASFYGIGLGLIGGVALLFIIIGGFTILTSQGNAHQVGVGKSYITYAILGLLLAVFGFVFIEVVLIDMLHVPGLGR